METLSFIAVITFCPSIGAIYTVSPQYTWGLSRSPVVKRIPAYKDELLWKISRKDIVWLRQFDRYNTIDAEDRREAVNRFEGFLKGERQKVDQKVDQAAILG